jgi:hypothetical protein
MLVARAVPRPLLIILAVLCAVVLATPLVGARGGNSADAQACQKGGWASLATSEQPSVPFTNQGACVSYSARGAVAVAINAAPVAHMEFINVGGGGQGTECALRGWLAGDTDGISSVSMLVWFDRVLTDGTPVTFTIPISLSAPSFDSTTDDSYLYLIGVPDRVTAEATYFDGTNASLPTAFAPVGCAGNAP